MFKRKESTQTELQKDLADGLEAAEAALAGLDVLDEEVVPEVANWGLGALAMAVVSYVQPDTRFWYLPEAQRQDDSVNTVGVSLGTGSKDGAPFRMVLVTHRHIVGLYPEGSPPPDVLSDGYRPTPLEHLDGFRLRLALPGLLRLLEENAQALVDMESWHWDEGDDEAWHPTEMLPRIENLRREVHDRLMVRELLES